LGDLDLLVATVDEIALESVLSIFCVKHVVEFFNGYGQDNAACLLMTLRWCHLIQGPVKLRIIRLSNCEVWLALDLWLQRGFLLVGFPGGLIA
jgi:hypothetical protein